MAATAWLKIAPVENRVEVKLDFPEKAQPGEKVTIAVSLEDKRGKPQKTVNEDVYGLIADVAGSEDLRRLYDPDDPSRRFENDFSTSQLFDNEAINTFLVKLSWWLPV